MKKSIGSIFFIFFAEFFAAFQLRFGQASALQLLRLAVWGIIFCFVSQQGWSQAPHNPPVVNIVSPTNNTQFNPGTNIAVSVTATSPSGTVTNVALYKNGVLLANVANAPYNFIWSNVPSGNYTLTAVATDDAGISSNSAPVAVRVGDWQAIQKLQQIKTVFVIGMENHNFTQLDPTAAPQQIYTNPAAYYMNTLFTPGHSNAVQASYATRYFGACIGAHPSEANYVWAEAGTDFGVHTDYDPLPTNGNIFNANHLTRQLNVAGIPWKNYQEDVEYVASPTNSGGGFECPVNPYNGKTAFSYVPRHNPMAFFTDTQLQNCYPLSNLWYDLANNSVGRYNWITPDQFNDAHTALPGGFSYHGTAYTSDQAAVASADNFLATVIPRIMASDAYKDNGLIIVRFDETMLNDTTNEPIPEIIISPVAKGNAYAGSVEYNHSSDVKTMDEIFGLDYASYFTNAIPANERKIGGQEYNYVSTVNDLSDLFRLVPRIGVLKSGAVVTNGTGMSVFGVVNVGSIVTNIITVTNSGLATLTLTALNITGANSNDFVTAGIVLPATIDPGGNATFQLIFTPSAAGTRSAVLQIINDDVVRSPFTFALTGAGNVRPIITVPANMIVEATNAAGNVVNFTVTAQDAQGTSLVPQVAPVSGSVFPLGTNTVIATATDSNHFANTNSFVVIVRDTTPPVIASNGTNPLKQFQYVAFIDPGATANDIVSGAVGVTTNSTVNVSKIGDYSVQYTATDAAGNSTTNTRTVEVVALPVPVGFNGTVVSSGNNRGAIQLSFSGDMGQPYRVLGTDDLNVPMTNWTVLANSFVTNNPMTFVDPGAITNLTRFYRVVSP